jgi:hypothetical protein
MIKKAGLEFANLQPTVTKGLVCMLTDKKKEF